VANCGAEHGKVCATLDQLERSDKEQWEVINILRDRATKTMTGVVLTLIVVIMNLVVLLLKK